MRNRAKDRRRESLPVDYERRRADLDANADRRAHERVPVDIEVDYRASDTFLFAYITDISAMGIFIQTNRPEPPGTRLNLCFRSHTGRLLEVAGEVIWVNPERPHDAEGRNPGMGVRFVDLDDDVRDELLRMVRTFAYLDDDKDEDDRVGDPMLESMSAARADALGEPVADPDDNVLYEDGRVSRTRNIGS
jgi:type IV pilus assembly protein PilZ